MHFQARFFIVFFPFWPPKMEPKSMIFSIILKNVDFVKIMVFLKENCYFTGFEPTKNDQKSMPTSHSKSSSEQTPRNSILGPFWPPRNFQKNTKIAPQSDVKRSLFRDAMEITPASSKVNGPHSFWITNMATHMIRST